MDFLALYGDAKERYLEQVFVKKGTSTPSASQETDRVRRPDFDNFYVDLLLFHVEQLRNVVAELKIGEFKPECVGF